MRGLLVALCTSVLLLGGCSSSLKSVEPPAALKEYKPELRVEPVWSAKIDQGAEERFLKLAPVVDDGQLYATSRSGLVTAFDRMSGKRSWKTHLGTRIFGGAGVGEQLLVVGGDAVVVALDKYTGDVRWKTDVSSEVLAPPVPAGDVIVARAIDGSLYGLSASDGRVLWRAQQDVPLLSLRGQGTPEVVQELVVAGFANGKLAAYGLHDGAQIWEDTVSIPHGRTELDRLADVDASLTLAGGAVFAAGYHGRVAAFALGDGRPLWARDLSSYTGTALRGTALFVTGENGNVWAFDGNSGGTLWKQNALHGRELSAPAVQGDMIVVGDYAGYVHWLAAEDGHLLARTRVHMPDYYWPVKTWSGYPQSYKEDRAILATPVVVDDMVYFLDKRGALNAFRVRPVKH